MSNAVMKFSLPKLGGTKQLRRAAGDAKKEVKKAVKKAPAPVKKALSDPKKAAKKAGTTIKKAAPKAPTGTTVRKAVKTNPLKKAPAPVKKAAKVLKSAAGTRMGGAGYRKFEGDAMWLPNTPRPDWLDGSLPGDRGFDPLGLSKPVEYLQVDVDQLDQNAAVNKMGSIVGTFTPEKDVVSTDRLQPYSEVFGLGRFRECELIHGRWCMLATLGVIVAESNTGVSWVDAGKVELDGSTYFGLDLPFSITQLCWIEALAVGGAEVYRSTELDPTKRCYPGGYFDPLALASDDSDRTFRLREAEIKHGRLAMLAFLGFGVQALSTGEGALGSLSYFANNL